MSDETYFKDLIRKIKELRVSSGSGEIIVPSENEDTKYFFETKLPFTPRDFAKLNTVEKESLFIWLNKDNMPQA